ncbi:hypothetical protein FG379_002359 [Cryptosporidium bovis]|uniref:uncharacterized protein n=1 Tax=Cryptosporidium bovis TaxID=310047 RepID=UPI00351A02B1|nr:hypothetical protein FG379_002359 [Cryptosporidium bovis]
MIRHIITKKELVRFVRIAINICILGSIEFVTGKHEGDRIEYGDNGNNVVLNKESVLTKAPPVTLFGDPSVTLVIPARKVCHKGSFDSEYNSCTYIDKKDEAVPIYEVG